MKIWLWTEARLERLTLQLFESSLQLVVVESSGGSRVCGVGAGPSGGAEAGAQAGPVRGAGATVI